MRNKTMKYMKNVSKYIYAWLVMGMTGLMALSFGACSDDIPADSYYSYTGQLMSDYLKDNNNYSQFTAIVNRAAGSQRGVNIMDLLATYGKYTCFAPTNAAVNAYLAENGYNSIEEIPVDVCDTIARTHLINSGVSTEAHPYSEADFTELLGEAKSADLPVNMNGRYLSLDGVYWAASYRIGGTGIITPANDSVDNGIVHTINAVLSSSNKTVADLMAQDERVKLFSEALTLTGLAEYIANHIKDETWDPDKEEYEPYHGKRIYSGAQWNYCYVPETRDYKFTVFACPDEVLATQYGITDVQGLYNYAKGIYGGPDYSATLDFTDPQNPLHRLISYHCLPFAQSYDHYTSLCSIKTNDTKAYVNPVEWYSTMDTLTTIKITRMKSAAEMRVYGGVEDEMYLNRSDNSRSNVHWPGVHVNRPDSESGYDQNARNGTYFLIDGLVDYSEETKNEIFNTRIRFDIIDCFPEMLSNNLRNYDETHTTTSSEDPASPARNYILPNGYLDGVKVNTDGFFLYQGARNTYWSYEGDEFNCCSDVNSYDVEFYLPSVPTGTYQIRLGFADMPTRGICQFYLDGEPKGVPFDERDTNFEMRTGYVPLSTLDGSSYTSEEREAAKKNMHNLGWYHGPKGVFNATAGHKDGRDALGNVAQIFSDNPRTVRYVLSTETLEEHVRHKIRIKSIWAVGTALIMLDYLELVPKSVYGVEGEGRAEDDY